MFNPLSIGFLKSKVFLFALYTALVFGTGVYFQAGKQAKKEVKMHDKALVAHEKQLNKDEKVLEKAHEVKTKLNEFKVKIDEKIHTINSSRVIDPEFTRLYNEAIKKANAA